MIDRTMTRLAAAAYPMLAVAFGFTGLVWVAGVPDGALGGAFERALDRESTVAGHGAAGTGVASQPASQVSGSEEFWLTRKSGLTPASFAIGIAAGHKITLGSGADQRILEVVAVQELGAPVGGQPQSERLVLVTCRDTARPDASPMRLVVNADDPLLQGSGAPQARAL